MKVKGEDIYPNSFYDATIILLPKTKILTKILPEIKITEQ